MLLALVACLIVYTPKALEGFAEQRAIKYAQKEVEKTRLLINYYNQHIGDKVNMSDDLQLAIGHQNDEKKLPVPFTFLVEVNEAYGDLSDNFSVYSPYPFEGRVRKVSTFDKEAWETLNSQIKPYYIKREKQDGNEWVNIAVPQTMTSTQCTACHNAHPQSVKRDWEIGDMRAIFKTRISLSSARQKGHEIARNISIALAMVILLSFIMFLLFFNRKKSEDNLRNMALSDSMTKLQNKFSFQASIQTLMEDQALFYLLYMDLDGFKTVNDSHGHDAGDFVLKIVAERMKQAVTDKGYPFRLGGDEFAIILGNTEDEREVKEVADQLLNDISLPINFNGTTLNVGCSIGIAVSNLVAGDAEELIQLADRAMYASKQAGKNQYTFADGIPKGS